MFEQEPINTKRKVTNIAEDKNNNKKKNRGNAFVMSLIILKEIKSKNNVKKKLCLIFSMGSLAAGCY